MTDDQSPEGLYLTAKEAAAELGVSVSTLYAYVSRNRLRSVEQPGKAKTRNRRYWRADIERLKSGKQANEDWPIAADTSITLLTKDGLFYRGQSVEKLADTGSFEDAAEILWDTQGTEVFDDELPPTPTGFEKLSELVAELDSTQRLVTLLPYLESCNPKAYDLSREGFARTAAGVTRLCAGILCGAKPTRDPLHEFLANRLNAPSGFDDILRRLLVIMADHELDPSAYAVRALANTGATPHRAVAAGLMAFNGRRLWAKPIDSVARLVNEIFQAKDPCEPILRRFRAGDDIPGFFKGIHEIKDPRPAHLLKALSQADKGAEEFERLEAALRAAEEIAGVTPHILLVATYISRRVGYEDGDLALVCLSRSAGWLAHALEQFLEHPLVRPRANYVGALPGNPRG